MCQNSSRMQTQQVRDTQGFCFRDIDLVVGLTAGDSKAADEERTGQVSSASEKLRTVTTGFNHGRLNGDTGVVGTQTRSERAKEQGVTYLREEMWAKLVGRMSGKGGSRAMTICTCIRGKVS